MGRIAESPHGPELAERADLAQLLPARLRTLAGISPQLSRYALVSLVALALDFALYIALTRSGIGPVLAGVVGYAAGTVLHYALSTRFVFDAAATDKMQPRLFGEFALSGLVGIGITALVIALATGVAGLPALPAKVLAAGISFLAVFVLRRQVVFARSDFALPAPPRDIYLKLTVAGAVFFFVIEFAYFVLSPVPSFWKPSLDAFGGTAIGRDFLNTWMAGLSAFGSGPEPWYDFRAYNQHLLQFIGVSAEQMHRYVWSYPPHTVLLVWPFGLLPYLPAFLLWTALGFAAFLYVAHSAGVERKNLMLIAVAPAVAINVFIGQNGLFLSALLIFVLTNLDRRPVLSGVLLGALTVKPQLGLLLPFVLLMTGRWRVIAAAAATTVVLVGATAWLYGIEAWTGYFATVVPQQKFLQEYGEGTLFLQVPSAFWAARLVGLPLGAAWALQAIVSAAALAAVAWAFWRRRDRVLSNALLVVAIFLFAPYTLNYDMVIFGWVAALLLQRQDNEVVDHYLIIGLWSLAATMMLAGLVYVPLAMPLLVAFAGRLLWRLARAETGQTVEAGMRVPMVEAAARPAP